MTFSGILVKLCAVLVSFLVFAVAGEIAVRIYTRTHILYDMEMSRYARELKLASSDPRIAHVHKPNASARLMGVEVRTNSDGLRDREYPVERNGNYRVIFLGDSQTLGWGVRQEESFESLMEEEINKRAPTEIINFGIGNYNAEQETHLFIEKGLKYRPDQVAVFYTVNDPEPTPQVRHWSLLEESELLSFYWSRVRGLMFHFAAAENYRDYYASLYRPDQPGWETWKKSIVLLKQICQDRGIKLQVVMLPEPHQLRDYPFEKEYAAVSDFLRANGIEHLDLTPFFKDEAEPARLWVAPDDGHPNAIGHRLIAQYAFDFIFPRGR